MFTCPCCGYSVFENFPGSYDICPICFWEDDITQLFYPEIEGGTNDVSLIAAQVNFFQFGAAERRLTKKVRQLTTNFNKDPLWFALFEKRVELPNPEEADISKGLTNSVHELSYWLRSH
ncbi:MAG: CPCC family cysteine-rich protein [Pseudomonadota bacterium]